MEPNNTYEQEIDLKDLMFAVLYKWRPIILVAVVLAVLLGGYRAVSTYRSQNDAETVEKAQKDYEVAVELYEKNRTNCEREIENLKKSIEDQQEYLEKSELMNMSPYDEWVAQTVLFIKTDYQIMPDMVYQNLNFTDTILTTYRTSLTNLEFLQTVADEIGMDERYLEEIVSVSVSGNLLTIDVKGETEDYVEKIMDIMLEGVDDAKLRIRTSIGNHTVSMVSSSVGSLVDLGLQDKQKSQSDRLTTLNESLENKQDELNEMEEPEKPSTSTVAAVKSGVKYAVLGGVLGAFMVVFFVCVIFLMSDKLYSAKELKSRYRVKILGTLPVSSKKQFVVDAWLRKMEGRAGSGKDASVEYGLIAANISNYAGNVKSLMVAGTADMKLISQVVSGLESRLAGVKIITGGNVLRDEQALRQLPECDGVVLVEQCRRSLYSDVALEIEKAKDLEKAVVGCVVFE